MNFYLLIKDTKWGTEVEIVVEECLLTYERKKQMAEATE